MTMDPSRRFFLRSAGVAATVATSAVAAHPTAQAPAADGRHPASPTDAYVFFNPEEAAFVEAAVARLIPADETGPGAIDAGVPQFIDRQLAGAWGAGERLYRSGPWHPGTPQQGYQLPYTPAELFRTALAALREKSADRGVPFHRLAPAAQDKFLRRLQTGEDDLGGVPAEVFFESLWALTLEGFFGDPVYGGNRGMVGWKLIGFPGAYANYYHHVDRHNLPFEGPTVSLADNGRGIIHIHPDIPSSHGGAVSREGAGHG